MGKSNLLIDILDIENEPDIISELIARRSASGRIKRKERQNEKLQY